jgi:hypothetical protein
MEGGRRFLDHVLAIKYKKFSMYEKERLETLEIGRE